jgi:hypothetical protein
MKTRSLYRQLIISAIFAISMAYLESAIVVYLRELYYPHGFEFPLKQIPLRILLVETGREAATIVLLFSYAKTIGRNGREVFYYFALNFGLWDIWYYLWLKIFIDWPSSLMDWDILFLIPQPWAGPVLAPVLVSLGLIFGAFIMLKSEETDHPISLSWFEWVLEAAAGLVIIISFLKPLASLPVNNLPQEYSWCLFLAGFLTGIIIFARKAIMKQLENRRPEKRQ